MNWPWSKPREPEERVEYVELWRCLRCGKENIEVGLMSPHLYEQHIPFIRLYAGQEDNHSCEDGWVGIKACIATKETGRRFVER